MTNEIDSNSDSDSNNKTIEDQQENLLSDEDWNDALLAHQYRLALPSSPTQSNFRVLALLFYKETTRDSNGDSDSHASHLPPWVRQVNVDPTTGQHRSFIVGTNDEPGYMGGAICAERAAMVQLRFVPSFQITKLVIATDCETVPISPGMLCREFLAGHGDSVPWDLKVISTGSMCTLCHRKDGDIVPPLQWGKTYQNSSSNGNSNGNSSNTSNDMPCCGVNGRVEHSLPTLRTTIAELYPFPSPYTRLTAPQSVALGTLYAKSPYRTLDPQSLNGNSTSTSTTPLTAAKRLLTLAVSEAERSATNEAGRENHPIHFGAAVMFRDGSISTSHQSSALEYGCSLDAVSQLVPYIEDKQKQQQQQQQQQQQNSSILVESKPFASESQPVARQKQPLAETSTSSNKDVVSVSVEAEKSQTTVLESPSKPRAPKKLSIRIPSLATIKAKSLSSPKSGSNSPTVSSSNTASGNKMDNVLADTPEAKTMEKATSKRKRTSEVITPSTDDASTEATPEPPVKRRIKVAIGKSSLHESDVFAASDVIVALSADDGSTKAKFPAVKEDGLEEMDLAPSAEETIGETKKKKKKAERAKSPRPKSPLAKPASSGQLVKNNSTEAVKDKPQIGSSRGSAFDKKSSKDDESKLKETLLVASSLAESRTRKAAVDAKEKMLARQKAKLAAKELKEKEDALPESGKKKKKRRRQEDVEEQKPDSETEQNDPEWVQCDSCMKWRVLPDNVKVSSLPELWYCHMNIYDKKRNNCEAQEQTSKEALKERKERKRRLKLKKRARREAEMAESKQVKKGKQQDEEMPMNAKKKSKLEKLNAEKQTPRSTSPKPGKTIKTKGATADSKRAIAEAKRANLEGGKKSKVKLEEASPTDSGSDTKKEGKKKGKKAKKEVQESSDIQDSETSADGKKRKRGRPARNQTTAVVPSTSNEKEDEDNVEWVQCDKCQKWRKLPAHISADELGQFWNCAMNTWNPDSASCEADEDKTDAHHQEVGVLEWQLRQTHAGKYSYRQMIFGPTARKSNRPPSEKARAAESLFVMPSNDETQYTKSSAFLPRVSNFNKNNATEEKTLNIFDVLGNSNLWDELKRIDPKPAKILSSNFANIPGYANTTKMIKTYECLTNEIKHAMQDVVLQTLEFGCLTADEVIGKAQWFPYEAGVSGGVKAYCNPEIIIHTLLDLVRDGIVEMNTVRDAYLPITEWIPKYRRVGTRRAIEAVEAIKASRCMKIAKPWKQRSNKPAEEWVTGVPRS
mmetsp:Transcript_6736/g.16822  ORF Transcript_6736/g.16822 Transcript_6736/m.16822 type:complete len:1251 (-) Transcript_6736:110-3862(-)